jgi:L-rhamnose mutarotase
MNKEIDEFDKLLESFLMIPDITSEKTVFDITGYPHYENVASNILKFFLDYTEEHKLGSLVLDALLELSSPLQYDLKNSNITIDREVATLNSNRIDLVIETDPFVIGIENKIFHYVNNPFEDYHQYLDKNYNHKDIYEIVLALKEESNIPNYVKSITYNQLWDKVEENIDAYNIDKSNKWWLFLQDFMRATRELGGHKMEIDQVDKYFLDNDAQIEKLLQRRSKFFQKLESKISILDSLIEEPQNSSKWIYKKRCIVFDYEVESNRIAFDLELFNNGIYKLTLFGRDRNSNLFLENHICDIQDFTPKYKNGRIVLSEWSFEEDLSSIAATTQDYLNLIFPAIKS